MRKKSIVTNNCRTFQLAYGGRSIRDICFVDTGPPEIPSDWTLRRTSTGDDRKRAGARKCLQQFSFCWNDRFSWFPAL